MGIFSEYLKEELPREKLLKYGPEKLTEVELLALILRSGTKNNNILDISREILRKHSTKSLSRKPINELIQIKGVKEAKACQISALFEFCRRFNSSKYFINTNSSIKNSNQVYDEVKVDFQGLDVERVMLICVNAKNQILKKEFIFEGGFDTSFVDLRIVLKKVLNESASGFFILHNHPSGNTKPSQNDINVTKDLNEVCLKVNISFLDHIIIGNDYFSFADEGLM